MKGGRGMVMGKEVWEGMKGKGEDSLATVMTLL